MKTALCPPPVAVSCSGPDGGACGCRCEPRRRSPPGQRKGQRTACVIEEFTTQGGTKTFALPVCSGQAGLGELGDDAVLPAHALKQDLKQLVIQGRSDHCPTQDRQRVGTRPSIGCRRQGCTGHSSERGAVLADGTFIRTRRRYGKDNRRQTPRPRAAVPRRHRLRGHLVWISAAHPPLSRTCAAKLGAIGNLGGEAGTTTSPSSRSPTPSATLQRLIRSLS